MLYDEIIFYYYMIITQQRREKLGKSIYWISGTPPHFTLERLYPLGIFIPAVYLYFSPLTYQHLAYTLLLAGGRQEVDMIIKFLDSKNNGWHVIGNVLNYSYWTVERKNLENPKRSYNYLIACKDPKYTDTVYEFCIKLYNMNVSVTQLQIEVLTNNAVYVLNDEGKTIEKIS